MADCGFISTRWVVGMKRWSDYKYEANGGSISVGLICKVVVWSAVIGFISTKWMGWGVKCWIWKCERIVGL